MRTRTLILALIWAGLLTEPALAQEPVVPESFNGPPVPEYQMVAIRPLYVPVMDLMDLLGATRTAGIYRLTWRENGGESTVEIRPQVTVNQLILTGSPQELRVVEDLIRAVDVPPRQIEIEARIMEVDKSGVSDLGIDWDGLWRASSTAAFFSFQKDQFIQERQTGSSSGQVYDQVSETDDERRDLRVSSRALLADFVNILEQSGAGWVRSTPRILTLNGRSATILDGQRVTYVTRVSSHTNIYETQTMDAGLKLEVLPTLGESGYLILDIQAELTGLSGRDYSGSPVKDGQIINNTVILEDGGTLLLGGFERHLQQESTKRFPVLGHLLPVIFSREVREEQTLQSVIVLTARSVDPGAPLDEDVRGMMEGD